MTAKKRNFTAAIVASGCVLTLMCIIAIGAQAQDSSNAVSNAEVNDAVTKLKMGKANGYHIGILGEAHAVQAIPDLERQFTATSDPLDKAKIAQVLVSLGDKNEVYWNYLSELVRPALDTEVPSPVKYDKAGKSLPGLSDQFANWARSHGQQPDEAGENEIYVLPGIVMLVGATNDPRANSLLRQALNSPNPLIQIAASDWRNYMILGLCQN